MTTFEVLGVNDTSDTSWLLVDDGCGPDWIESKYFVSEQEAWALVRLAAGDYERGLAAIDAALRDAA